MCVCIAYLQDIEALDKKINALAEQSHSNDVAMFNTYTTVDEVNEVLTNYVQKSESLTINEHYSTFYDIKEEAETETKKLKIYNAIKSESLLMFTDINNKKYFVRTDFKNKIAYLDEIYNLNIVSTRHNGWDYYFEDIDFQLLNNYSTYEKIYKLNEKIDFTNYALKNDYETLKAENAELKAQIASFEQQLSALENKF